MALSLTSKQKVALDYYIAAYGRAPAQVGLDFFGEKLSSGEMTEEQIRDYMMSNEEAQLRYPNTGTPEEQVNTVFKNVLGREVATDAGMKFYTDKLATDGYDMGDLMADVLAIAQNPDNYVDADTLRSKAEVAEYYLEVIPADQQQNLPYYLAPVNFDNATVHQAHEAINGMVGTGLPISLTTKTDSVSTNGQFTEKGTDNQAEIEGTDTLGVKTSVADDTINAPMITEDRVKKNTLNQEDSIIDPSNTDDDTLEAFLAYGIGTNGSAGLEEDGPTITDIENITLRGINTVGAYSLKNVTSTAEDDASTKDVNEGATIVVNIDHNDVAGAGKFVSSTDVEVGAHAVVSNVDGNDIKEVNLIDHTTSMNFAEVGNNATINLTNGKIKSIGIDAIDDAKLATEDITINMLDDDDGKLTLGLYNDADTTDAYDGGGFKNVNLVTSDAAMNVLLADGTHLNNSDLDAPTEADGEGGSDDDDGDTIIGASDANVLLALATAAAAAAAAAKTDADAAKTAADTAKNEAQTDRDNAEAKKDDGDEEMATYVSAEAALTTAKMKQAFAAAAATAAAAAKTAADTAKDNAQAVVDGLGDLPAIPDNLADSLNLSGTKDITITGTDEQLDEATIRSDMSDDATSTLALEITGNTHVVDLTDAEVNLIKVDASILERNLFGRDKAYISVDDATTVEVNKIGDEGVLTITGETEHTDNLDIIINTNRNDANNGRLILGGDDLHKSETATAATEGGDSTEAGASGNPATTQGVDADNAVLHVNVTDSVLDQLDISALLGMVTIDGDKDLNIEDGGLIFDDNTVGFNDANNFIANTDADNDTPFNLSEGEGAGRGYGGDWIDATAMTGDLNIILRDGTSNIIHAGTIHEPVTPMSNAKNGIKIDFGSGDDRITGLGTAVGPFAEEAGDNIDMGAGDDEVIIGVNDTTTNRVLNVPSVGSAQSGFNQVFNAVEAEDSDDRVVTDDEKTAAINYNGYVTAAGLVPVVGTGSMSYDRINAEVYLGEGEDHVIFRNQNSGFLADNNGVRIKDFQAGNHGDQLGFQMFQDGTEDAMPGAGKLSIDRQVSQEDLNLFNNGQVIADTDVGIGGKYIINGADINHNGLNDSTTLYTPGASLLPVAAFDGDDNGANDGNVVLISTADIHAFTNTSAQNLWASNSGKLMVTDTTTEGVFKDVVNVSVTITNDGHQYETIVLVGETTGTEGVKIFYVTDETAPDTAGPAHPNLDGVPTASLVGFLEGININDLEQDNFDFI